MDKSKLKNILSSVFDFEQWKNILTEMFPKVEYFTLIPQHYNLTLFISS